MTPGPAMARGPRPTTTRDSDQQEDKQVSDTNWYPGKVTLGDLGPYKAMIHLGQWNGSASPRFARPEAERVVADLHRLHVELAAQGDADAAEDLHWDPADPDEIVVSSYAEADENGNPDVQRLRADKDGRWAIGAFYWTWSVVAEEWPQRDAAVAKLCQDGRVRTLALALRAAQARLGRTEIRQYEPRRKAHHAVVAAERALVAALAEQDVPIGHLYSVAAEVREAVTAVLPHCGIVVPVPYPVVTGVRYLEMSRGLAYVADVSWDGQPFGVIENEGDGGETSFTPTGSGEYRPAMARMRAFADACLDPAVKEPPGRMFEEHVYGALIDEFERARQVESYPADGTRTLVRVAARFGYEYLTLDCPPAQMMPRVRTALSGETGDLVKAGARCEYWDGACWMKVTIQEPQQPGSAPGA